MATPTNLPAAATVGQVLTAQYVNDLRGAFRVLQVQQSKATGLVSSAAGSYVDTGVSVTITPQATSSAMVIFASHSCFNTTSGTLSWFRLLRGATAVATFLDCFGGGNSSMAGSFDFNYYDLPNTTSAVTYKTQFLRGGGSGTCQVNVNSNPSALIVAEISL